MQATRRLVWSSRKHQLLAWTLSLETARKHYEKTSLFTDDEGARTLIDGIGLEFDTVSVALNALAQSDPEWWTLGKMMTYRAQTEPFIHIDEDVFLWQRLPEQLEQAPVFAQNAEYFSCPAWWYQPEALESVVQQHCGWLPDEWVWYRSSGQAQRGECCGIVGGSRVDFVRYWADLGIRMIEHPRNRYGWSRLTNKLAHMLLIEQYLLAVCIEYHRKRPDSPYSDIEIQYLFDSESNPFDPDCAARKGFTHLIGPAKQDALLMERLEKRVQRDYPERYERCLTYLGS
jgi:hypothetical protein